MKAYKLLFGLLMILLMIGIVWAPDDVEYNFKENPDQVDNINLEEISDVEAFLDSIQTCGTDCYSKLMEKNNFNTFFINLELDQKKDFFLSLPDEQGVTDFIKARGGIESLKMTELGLDDIEEDDIAKYKELFQELGRYVRGESGTSQTEKLKYIPWNKIDKYNKEYMLQYILNPESGSEDNRFSVYLNGDSDDVSLVMENGNIVINQDGRAPLKIDPNMKLDGMALEQDKKGNLILKSYNGNSVSTPDIMLNTDCGKVDECAYRFDADGNLHVDTFQLGDMKIDITNEHSSEPVEIRAGEGGRLYVDDGFVDFSGYNPDVFMITKSDDGSVNLDAQYGSLNNRIEGFQNVDNDKNDGGVFFSNIANSRPTVGLNGEYDSDEGGRVTLISEYEDKKPVKLVVDTNKGNDGDEYQVSLSYAVDSQGDIDPDNHVAVLNNVLDATYQDLNTNTEFNNINGAGVIVVSDDDYTLQKIHGNKKSFTGTESSTGLNFGISNQDGNVVFGREGSRTTKVEIEEATIATSHDTQEDLDRNRVMTNGEFDDFKIDEGSCRMDFGENGGIDSITLPGGDDNENAKFVMEAKTKSTSTNIVLGSAQLEGDQFPMREDTVLSFGDSSDAVISISEDQITIARDEFVGSLDYEGPRGDFTLDVIPVANEDGQTEDYVYDLKGYVNPTSFGESMWFGSFTQLPFDEQNLAAMIKQQAYNIMNTRDNPDADTLATHMQITTDDGETLYFAMMEIDNRVDQEGEFVKGNQFISSDFWGNEYMNYYGMVRVNEDGDPVDESGNVIVKNLDGELVDMNGNPTSYQYVTYDDKSNEISMHHTEVTSVPRMGDDGNIYYVSDYSTVEDGVIEDNDINFENSGPTVLYDETRYPVSFDSYGEGNDIVLGQTIHTPAPTEPDVPIESEDEDIPEDEVIQTVNLKRGEDPAVPPAPSEDSSDGNSDGKGGSDDEKGGSDDGSGDGSDDGTNEGTDGDEDNPWTQPDLNLDMDPDLVSVPADKTRVALQPIDPDAEYPDWLNDDVQESQSDELITNQEYLIYEFENVVDPTLYAPFNSVKAMDEWFGSQIYSISGLVQSYDYGSADAEIGTEENPLSVPSITGDTNPNSLYEEDLGIEYGDTGFDEWMDDQVKDYPETVAESGRIVQETEQNNIGTEENPLNVDTSDSGSFTPLTVNNQQVYWEDDDGTRSVIGSSGIYESSTIEALDDGTYKVVPDSDGVALIVDKNGKVIGWDNNIPVLGFE